MELTGRKKKAIAVTYRKDIVLKGFYKALILIILTSDFFSSRKNRVLEFLTRNQ